MHDNSMTIRGLDEGPRAPDAGHQLDHADYYCDSSAGGLYVLRPMSLFVLSGTSA